MTQHRWHYRLDGPEFEQALGVGDGQGGLVCCSPWGRKEADTAEGLNWIELLTPGINLTSVSTCFSNLESHAEPVIAHPSENNQVSAAYSIDRASRGSTIPKLTESWPSAARLPFPKSVWDDPSALLRDCLARTALCCCPQQAVDSKTFASGSEWSQFPLKLPPSSKSFL